MNTNPAKIIMLAGKGISTNILYHALEKEFSIEAVILEEVVDRKTFLKKRIHKLGAWKVFGQIAFQSVIIPLLNSFSKKRKQEIIELKHLNSSAIPEEKITRVGSVNDDSCKTLLRSFSPAIVVVNGTRIISKDILNAVDAVFINMHAGITPKYRGVHGAYWALVNEDKENCGVTVHSVDEGIDTGDQIEQMTIDATPKDNFTTYPLLQTAGGLPLMINAIRSILAGKLITSRATGESKLWSHPTFRQYIVNRIRKGVK
jgi:folate-dependent phosphoribosylglycinamide formyltransferase PurN